MSRWKCASQFFKHLSLKHVNQSQIISKFSMSYKKNGAVKVIGKLGVDPFVKTFLFDVNDRVKQKWPIIKEYAEQANETNLLKQSEYQFIKQRYDCFELWDLENCPINLQQNTFLKKISDGIADETNEDGSIKKMNETLLTAKQLERCKEIINSGLSLQYFKESIPKLGLEIISHCLGEFDSAMSVENSLDLWCSSKYLSFGHPQIVEYHSKVSKNENLKLEELICVARYMKLIQEILWKEPEGKLVNQYLKCCFKNEWFFCAPPPSLNPWKKNEMQEYLLMCGIKHKRIDDIIGSEKVKQKLSTLGEGFNFQEYWTLLHSTQDDLVRFLWKNIDVETDDELAERVVNRLHLNVSEDIEKIEDIGCILNVFVETDKFSSSNENIAKHRTCLLLGEKKLDSDYALELVSILCEEGLSK